MEIRPPFFVQTIWQHCNRSPFMFPICWNLEEFMQLLVAMSDSMIHELFSVSWEFFFIHFHHFSSRRNPLQQRPTDDGQAGTGWKRRGRRTHKIQKSCGSRQEMRFVGKLTNGTASFASERVKPQVGQERWLHLHPSGCVHGDQLFPNGCGETTSTKFSRLWLITCTFDASLRASTAHKIVHSLRRQNDCFPQLSALCQSPCRKWPHWPPLHRVWSSTLRKLCNRDLWHPSRPSCNNTANVPSFTSFSNTIRLRTVWCGSTMIPGEIFTGFAKFQGIVNANDFKLPIRLQELLQAPLCLLKSFVLHGYDWIHWVAKSCTTTAYRWLFRDSQPSLRTLWSAVIKSPKFSARGTAPPMRFLHGPLVILVLWQISQFGSSGKWA